MSTKLLVLFELPELRLQLLVLLPELIHALLVCFTDIASSLRRGGWHAAVAGGCFDLHAGITRGVRLYVVGVRLVVALVGFCFRLLLLSRLDHAKHLNRQRVVHEMRDEVLSNGLDMLARVREVWVALLLLHLCFKYGFVSIDPLVLRHRLEDELVGNVHCAFQL